MFPTLAQYSPRPEQLEQVQQPRGWWHPLRYSQAVFAGGPMDIGVHLLMLAFTVHALMRIRRGRLDRTTLVACFVPFVCGATSMWLRVRALEAIALSQSGDMVRGLSDARLPFLAGGTITICLLLISRFAAGHKAARGVGFSG